MTHEERAFEFGRRRRCELDMDALAVEFETVERMTLERVEAEVKRLREALGSVARIADSYTDGIAARCCASVAHGIAAKIREFLL